MELPKEYKENLFKERKVETPLDKLLSILNEAREGKYTPITYPRLNKMLQKLGKSKRDWDQSVFIADVLEAKNPSSYFWSLFKRILNTSILSL